MSEFALEGPDLKRMVKLARKDALPFAFNPGKNESEHFFTLHRKRPPNALGKIAKAEGVGKRAAFGTCKVVGKVMQLQCEVEVPTMAKALKRFLKANKLSLNVEILDKSGKVIESDIEDLPDDPELDEADDGDDGDVSEPGSDDGTEDGPSAEELVARIKKLQAIMAKAPQKVTDDLAPALKKAVGAIKEQKLDAAGQLLDKIEGVLAKLIKAQSGQSQEQETDPALAQRLAAIKQKIDGLEGPMAEKLAAAFAKVDAAFQAGNEAVAAKGADQLEAALAKVPAPETSDAPPPPPPPPSSDEQIKKLAQLVQNFRTQAGLLESKDAAAEVLNALKPAAELIKAGDKTGATAQLTQVRALLEAAKAAQAEAKQTESAPPDTPDDGTAPSGPEYEAWMAAFNRIEPDVSRALSEGLVEDVSLLRRDWSDVVGKAEKHDYAGALQALGPIRDMLDAGRNDGGTAHLEHIPEDVRPFAISRLKWNETRKTMMSEVSKLEQMIQNVMADDEDFSMDEKLSTRLDNFDHRLSDALDKIIDAPEGDGREAAKSAAADVLKEFRNELNTPFFNDVDNNSGFGSVSVAGSAKRALDEIAKVLA